MNDIISLLISTLVLTSTYSLVAIGISLVWSSLGMLNLAQGITFTLAGFGAWATATYLWATPLAIVTGGMLTGALIGLIVAGLAFLPLKRQQNYPFRALTITLALNMVGSQLLLEFFGPNPKNIPELFTFSPITIGSTTILPQQIGSVVVSVVVLTAIMLWFRNSRGGLRVRALMQNPEGASLVGVSVNATAGSVLAISGMLAGLAAVLLEDTYFVSPTSWGSPLAKGLVISLLGGLGSIPGAIAGALVLGAAEAVTARYLGGQYVIFVQFGIVIAVLIFRPRGIAGLLDEVREADE